MKTLPLPSLLAISFALSPAAGAADQATKDLAAGLAAKHGDALVTVEATLEIQPKILEAPEALKGQIQGIPKTEQKTSSQGVVIDPSGIVAVPLAAINPAVVMAAGIEQATPLGPIKIGADSKFLSVTVIDAEGGEHEAEVALQDQGTGLALVKLSEPPAGVWGAVALPAEAGAPAPFGQLVQIGRLGAIFERSITVRTSRFVQELRVPGLFYELAGTASAPGFAAFDSSSNFLGLGVLPLGLPPQEIASAGVVLLPASRIAPLAEKVGAAK